MAQVLVLLRGQEVLAGVVGTNYLQQVLVRLVKGLPEVLVRVVMPVVGVVVLLL